MGTQNFVLSSQATFGMRETQTNAIAIAHLGPVGTYAEAAAVAYARWLQNAAQQTVLQAYPSIARTLYAVAQGDAAYAVVPVENSIEGSVTVTLDTLWQLDQLKLQQALILPISHALLSHATSLEAIEAVYSHPQALSQCQQWLEQHLPAVKLIASSSTTAALSHLQDQPTHAAIASCRAAQLYGLPILAHPINDHADNCTRFWTVGRDMQQEGSHTALAFSLPANQPGALVRALELFAQENINLSRIESRPTKRSLGEYLFFVDIEAHLSEARVKDTLAALRRYTETLKVFGSYSIIPMQVEPDPAMR